MYRRVNFKLPSLSPRWELKRLISNSEAGCEENFLKGEDRPKANSNRKWQICLKLCYDEDAPSFCSRVSEYFLSLIANMKDKCTELDFCSL